MRIFWGIFLTVFILCSGFAAALQNKRITAKMESKQLMKGKVITVKGEVYYQYDLGKMVVHYTYPYDYFYITNNRGEVQMYYPETNQVLIQKSDLHSAQGELMYYFLSNKVEDLGLREAGFQKKDTDMDGNLVVTEWKPEKATDEDLVSKVKLVHEDYLPIYAAYFNHKDEVFKKIYYSEYTNLSMAMMPTRITEISYMDSGDSIISKMQYSDIQTGYSAQSPYFEFEVPADAKRVKLEELNLPKQK